MLSIKKINLAYLLSKFLKSMYELINISDPIGFKVSKSLPSSSSSSLNHSTVGTGLPSPLSQYNDIVEPSFIGPKVAPVLKVFLEFSSMTRTNAGCTGKI